MQVGGRQVVGPGVVAAVGIDAHFAFNLSACQHGVPKPDPGIFHAACARLGLAPHEVLHVGDHPHIDVAGAAAAGLRTCWIDRGDHAWPDGLPTADIRITSLAELADMLEASAPGGLTLHKDQAA